jgi:AMP-activated protein kinase-like protein
MRRIPPDLVVFCYLAVAVTAIGANHEFRYKAPEARSVDLMSDANGWKAVPMSKDSDGIWKATVSLSPGSHAYKFLVNGKDWLFDPDNPNRTKSDGIENSAIKIAADNSTAATAAPVASTVSSTSPSTSAVRSSPTPSSTVASHGLGLKPEVNFSPAPGDVVTVEVPLSARRRADVLKDKEANQKVMHARIGIAVPPGFDSSRSSPILIVTNTEAYSNIDSLRQFKDAAVAEGWVVLAADDVEAEKDKEGSTKWQCMGAAFDYLTAAWPGIKDWPVACGGMSGGAKNSSLLAADLAREQHRIIGVLMMGCNQDMLTVGFRKGGATSLLNAAVFISSGKSDTIAKPERAVAVKNSVQATGFHKVRLETYDGAHDIYQPHITEALRWFLTQSSPNGSGAPKQPSDFDKFFKKK